jgi:hypothetical protein
MSVTADGGTPFGRVAIRNAVQGWQCASDRLIGGTRTVMLVIGGARGRAL